MNVLYDLVESAERYRRRMDEPPADRGKLHSELESLGAFAREWIDEQAIDRDRGISPRVLDEARARGFFGWGVPEPYGGRGLCLAALAELSRELGRRCASLGVVLAAHGGLALRAVLERATPDQRRALLPSIARGAAILCFASTEPEAGSDLASLSTTAIADRDGFRISGSKRFITNAGIADYAVVLARMPEYGHAAFGLFVVDLEQPGVARGPEEHKLGLLGASNAPLEFRDVPVARDALLGAPGAGRTIAEDAIRMGRLLLASGALGIADRAIDSARAYTRSRIQFGKPLIELPLVRARLAGSESRIAACGALVDLALSTFDDGRPFVVWTHAAKLASSEIGFTVVDDMLGLHGARGYMEPNGIARCLRDQRATRIVEGSNDVIRLALFSEMMTWDLRATVPVLARAMDGALSAACAPVDRALGELFALLAEQCNRHGLSITRRQADCARFADAFVELTLAVALIIRTNRGHDPIRIARCCHLAHSAAAEARSILARVGSAADEFVNSAL